MDIDRYVLCFVFFSYDVNFFLSFDEIRFYGGIVENGCFVEFICVKKDGFVIFFVIGKFVDIVEFFVLIKCLFSE